MDLKVYGQEEIIIAAFMAGAASQAGDADSSRAPGLTSCLQESVNVHHHMSTMVVYFWCHNVHQLFCILHLARFLSSSSCWSCPVAWTEIIYLISTYNTEIRSKIREKLELNL